MERNFFYTGVKNYRNPQERKSRGGSTVTRKEARPSVFCIKTCSKEREISVRSYLPGEKLDSAMKRSDPIPNKIFSHEQPTHNKKKKKTTKKPTGV